jgi:hypothetical protein
MDPGMAEQMSAQAAETLKARLLSIVGRLQDEANDRVNKREHIEKRWLADLEQYHGKYDETTLKNLKAGNKSQLFVNMTRPKTDAMTARLEDLLFPTDDRNWGIRPTPVPSLTEEAEAAVEQAEQLAEQAKAAMAEQMGEDPQAMAQAVEMAALADAARNKADSLNALLDEAKRRSGLMELEIEDQLKESHYHAVARDQIESGAKIGTGVIKGPVTGDVLRKGWRKDSQTGEFAIDMSAGDTPSMRYVDVWNWYPDLDARTVEESDGFFERHLLNPKGLRKLAKTPGFSKEAIRRLLGIKPQSTTPNYLVTMRNITGQNQEITNDRYHVWEYTGCLTAEDMRDLALAMGDMDTLNDLEETDPLDELNAVVWFCQGEVLKFSIYPYDSGEPIYSVFNLIKDDSSIFGYGIPWVMRDAQRALNAAWRMMMDNAGLGTGPQIVINPKFIEPQNGSWEITPNKVWLFKEDTPKDARAFDQFNIEMHQGALAAIIQIAQKHIDDETALPQIAQGEQGSHITKTAQGMSILMNATNTVFRRIVKNFDDDVTVPTIRRFYDWNMQFNEKPEIKGDYEVDARGSSVLLVREMQSQNLLMIALQLGAHPIYGPMLKHADLLRKIFQAHMIPTAEVVLSDKDFERIAKEQAAAQAEQEGAEAGDGGAAAAEMKAAELEFKREELAVKVEIANMEMDAKLKLAQMARDTTMMQAAERMNMSVDQIEAKLQDSREEREARERKFAAEAAITERMGPSGGGFF